MIDQKSSAHGNADGSKPRGPLAGIRVVEFAGVGPTPFAAMMLADLGADIIRIERLGAPAVSAGDPRLDVLNRGRPSIALDLKAADGVAAAMRLVTTADVLLEGYRPGVMERLGFGPDACLAARPALVYARMTGWGQQGPLAHKAGHDINYIAMSGALHLMGPPGAPPIPPINLVGDFGGGAMLVVAGILAALVERQTSGRGQVVDAAMIDGSALLMAQIFGWSAMGFWRPERGANLLDGGAYFYRCYEAADGKYVAVGAIEPQFHAALLQGLGLDPAAFTPQMDATTWPDRSERLAAVFATRTRDEWVEVFESYDACVSPVLTPAEAASHPANRARDVFLTRDAAAQPAPAPRFSRTPAALGTPPGLPGEGGREALARWGLPCDVVDTLEAQGALRAS